MVIDVQTGENHTANVMPWFFHCHYDSDTLPQSQNTTLHQCSIKLTLPAHPKRKHTSGRFLSEAQNLNISFERDTLSFMYLAIVLVE